MKNAAIDRRGIFFWLRERKPGLLRLSFKAVLFRGSGNYSGDSSAPQKV